MLKFIWYCFRHIFWPVKGIVMLEVYFMAILYVVAKNTLIAKGAVLIMILAILIALTVRDERSARSLRGGVIRFIWRIFLRIIWMVVSFILAWVYLGIGVINGRLDDSHQPIRLRIGVDGRLHFDDHHPGLHYRLGRWFYRRFTALLNRIPFISARANPTVIAVVARAIAVLVCFWGVWDMWTFITK